MTEYFSRSRETFPRHDDCYIWPRLSVVIVGCADRTMACTAGVGTLRKSIGNYRPSQRQQDGRVNAVAPSNSGLGDEIWRRTTNERLSPTSWRPTHTDE